MQKQDLSSRIAEAADSPRDPAFCPGRIKWTFGDRSAVGVGPLPYISQLHNDSSHVLLSHIICDYIG